MQQSSIYHCSGIDSAASYYDAIVPLIDMEWLTRLKNDETGDSEEMEVEIGYQPKMEIKMV